MEALSELVVAARAGDHEAFGKIVSRFQNMAYAGAYGMTGDSSLAQDVAQEAFIEAYLNLERLREPAAFPGWFRRILIKQSDRQTRRKRLAAVPLEAAEWLPAEIPEPALLVEQQAVTQTVREAVAALPQDYRLVIALFYIQGYSQKEIAQFLELPVTTIKKRLFTARQNLKERMITMLKEHLQENKPSQTGAFARKVQFYIALRANDLDRVKQLVAEDPTLVHLKSSYDVSSQGYYWPLGVTPLYWAAGVGNEALLEFLLSQGANIDEPDPSGFTPLHHAVLLRQSGAVRLLLERGANINAQTKRGQTPLHHAVIRDNEAMVKLLLERQAELNAADQGNYTPLDWATLMGHSGLAGLLSQHGAKKSVAEGNQPSWPRAKAQPAERQVPVGESVTGRVLNALGQPLADSPPLTGVATQPVYHTVGEALSPVLETGIKLIDLFVPLKRGGHLGLFTPLAGVGKLVLMNQFIYRIAAFHQGYIVHLGLEEGEYTAASLIHGWRGEFGLKDNILEERVVHVFGQADSPVQARQQLAETGLTLAESFRRQGHEVLLVVDSRLALVEGVVPYLRAYAVTTPEAAITTLYHGDFTVGLEPPPLADLDAVITFDRERSLQRLYPAVDPLRSYSRLMQPELVGQDHVALVAQTRRLLQRYRELHYQVEKYGLDSLFYLDQRQEDEIIVRRARRLNRFLTQPFFGTEPWTGLPGQYVKLEATLAGCQAIISGQTDEWPEEALYFVGTLEQAARNSGNGDSAAAR